MIGVVDLQRCFTESREGKKAVEALKKKKAALQKKFDKKQNEFLKLQEELKKQSMMLSTDARVDKEKEYERMRRELRYTYEDLMKDMRKADAEVKKKMFKELEKVISEIGKAGGLWSLAFHRRPHHGRPHPKWHRYRHWRHRPIYRHGHPGRHYWKHHRRPSIHNYYSNAESYTWPEDEFQASATVTESGFSVSVGVSKTN